MSSVTIDIDSTHRNRNLYPNPFDFVISITNPNKGSTLASLVDPVLLSAPFTASLTKTVGELQTSAISLDGIHIALDPADINIDNFYINLNIQIGDEYRTISAYDGITKIVTVTEAFTSPVPAGLLYYIRRVRSYLSSDVLIEETTPDGMSVTKLALLSSNVSSASDVYVGSYIRYTNGPHVGQTSLVTAFEPVFEAISFQQPYGDGKSQKVSLTSNTQGFIITPDVTGKLKNLVLSLLNYDYVFPIRTLKLNIFNGSTISSPLLYTSIFNIENNNIQTNINLGFSGNEFSAVSTTGFSGKYKTIVCKTGEIFGYFGNNIAKYTAQFNLTNNIWNSIGTGVGNDVYAIETYTSILPTIRKDVYFGGFFSSASDQTVPAYYITRWDTLTNTYNVVKGGVNSVIYNMKIYNDYLYIVGGFLYASTGGSFSGTLVNRVARYDIINDSWSALGTGVNVGVNGTLFAINVDSFGNVYVGGVFTLAGGVAANNIAKWDVGTNTWSALGSGVNNTVYSIAIDSSDNIYAGGFFTIAGGSVATKIAKWNGISWSALTDSGTLTEGINGSIFSMSFKDDKLYFGGNFISAGGKPIKNIAVWDTTTSLYSSLNYLFSYGGLIRTIYIDNTNNILYVGGDFQINLGGGIFANYIIKCNLNTNVWSALNDITNNISGVGKDVWAIGKLEDSIYVGGTFIDLKPDSSTWKQIAFFEGKNFTSLCSSSFGDYIMAVTNTGDIYITRNNTSGYPKWNYIRTYYNKNFTCISCNGNIDYTCITTTTGEILNCTASSSVFPNWNITTFVGQYFTSSSIDMFNPNYQFVSSKTGIYRTTGGTATSPVWNLIYSPVLAVGEYITSINVSNFTNVVIFSTSIGNIYRSLNPTVLVPTWTIVFSASDNITKVIMAGSSYHLASSSTGKVYFSSNGDVAVPTWNLTENIGEQINDITFDGSGTYKTFVTNSGKIYSSSDIFFPLTWTLQQTFPQRPVVNAGNPYLITIQDISSNGSLNGYIELFGIPPSNNTYNLNVFPSYVLNIINTGSGSIEFQQPSLSPYLLDNSITSSICYGAYSFRKLKSSYTGSCIRVRRDNDNKESDIGFVNNMLDIFTLKTFVGSNNGYITIFYNQNYDGNNASNNLSSSSLQPLIVVNGVLEEVANMPAMRIGNEGGYLSLPSYPFTSSSSFSISQIVKVSSYLSSQPFFEFSLDNNKYIFATTDNIGDNTNFTIKNNPIVNTLSVVKNDNNKMYNMLFSHTSSDLEIYRDGISLGSIATTVLPSSINAISNNIGYSSLNNKLSNMYVSEMLIFTSVLSATQQNVLKLEQDLYYNVPLTPYNN